MGGLARICKMFGGMTVKDGEQTVRYVWDYAADEAVAEDQMPPGSERHKQSERAKWLNLAPHSDSESP